MPVSGHEDFKVLKKKYAKGVELRGKTLGIIGFGRIGQFTAKYALGAGMKIIAFDPFIENVDLNIDVSDHNININIQTDTFNNLLENSDFISLHVPMPKDGKAVLSSNEFDKMKNGVRIVNAARGGVIDEDDLISAINNDKVAAAALDVFVGEPKPREDLLSNKKISLTPHIGAATNEAQDRIGLELADKIIAFYNQ
jgi:D-3-phosphoglycerate dehydrogenase